MRLSPFQYYPDLVPMSISFYLVWSMHCAALQCLFRLPLQETGRISCGCSPRGRATAVASQQDILVFPREVAQQGSGQPSTTEDGLSDWAQLPPSLCPLLAAGRPGPGALGKQPFPVPPLDFRHHPCCVLLCAPKLHLGSFYPILACKHDTAVRLWLLDTGDTIHPCVVRCHCWCWDEGERRGSLAFSSPPLFPVSCPMGNIHISLPELL